MKKNAALTVDPLTLPSDVTLAMPGSKSHANRAIIAACLAMGTTMLTNATPCDDVVALVDNVRKMGFRAQWIDKAPGTLRIQGGVPSTSGRAIIDCSNAGTTLRFLTALCAVTPGEWVVTGSARMQQRPIGDLTTALNQLGADIEDTKGCPPLRIRGKALNGGIVTLDASKSSQFLSALLLIAPILKNGLTVTIASTLASGVYIALTRRVLQDFGSNCAMRGGKYVVRPSRMLSPGTITIEGDWSAAGAFLVLEELTGSRITLPNIDPRSTQADAKLPEVIRKLRGNGKRAIDCTRFPDQVMNIAVLAAHRKGETILTGAANLRLKESDRLGVLTQELQKAGIRIEEQPDGLRILHSPRLRSATLDPHDDHRMAMAFAILGCLHSKIRITDPGCVSKSYSHFWHDLKALHDSQRCIAIVGMRGAGKSTLGKALAGRLDRRHIDTDLVFIKKHGPILDYVKRNAWPSFRKAEEKIVATHLQKGNIVSLGGGAIESSPTRTLLNAEATVIWIQENVPTLLRRLRSASRPALTDLPLEKEVPQILHKRTPLYAGAAQIIIPPSLNPQKQLSHVLIALHKQCSW